MAGKTRSNNAMVQRSLKTGHRIPMSDREYVGRNPTFHVDLIAHTVTRTSKGVPYVRTR